MAEGLAGAALVTATYVFARKLVKRKRVRTEGAFTNTVRNPSGHNSKVLDKYPNGSGFSGSYDPATGKFLAYPSGSTRYIDGSEPKNWVQPLGGHRQVNDRLSTIVAPTTNRYGFVMTKMPDGRLEMRWNSRSINNYNPNFSGHTLPESLRSEVMDAISTATGRVTYSY